jgi:general secretion pathway protein H
MSGSAIDAASRPSAATHPLKRRQPSGVLSARRRARMTWGMSLIEVIVALSLVAVMMTVAILTLAPGRELALVKMEAAEIANLLALARSQAILNRRTTYVVMDAANNSVALGAAMRHILAAPARLTTRNNENQSILFRPDGESSGGSIEIRAGNRVAIVSVDWLSGRTRVTVSLDTAAAAS